MTDIYMIISYTIAYDFSKTKIRRPFNVQNILVDSLKATIPFMFTLIVQNVWSLRHIYWMIVAEHDNQPNNHPSAIGNNKSLICDWCASNINFNTKSTVTTLNHFSYHCVPLDHFHDACSSQEPGYFSDLTILSSFPPYGLCLLTNLSSVHSHKTP